MASATSAQERRLRSSGSHRSIERRVTEADGQQQHSPHQPAQPIMNRQRHQQNGHRQCDAAVALAGQCIEDVAAVQLAGGQQVERGGEDADPRGAPDRVQQQGLVRNARPQQGFEDALDQRAAEYDKRFLIAGKDKFRLGDGQGQRRHRDEETDQRAGDGHIEQSATIDDRRANSDESAEGADERGRGNEIWIRGVDAVVAAGEVVAEFVGEQDAHERRGEGNAQEKQARFEKRLEIGDGEIVERGLLADGVRRGELGSGGESRECRENKESDGDEQGAEGRLLLGPEIRFVCGYEDFWLERARSIVPVRTRARARWGGRRYLYS